MRKFWFAYLAKAIVAMPGGFGTLDEVMELATLVQTQKIKKAMPMVLFGTKFWDQVLNFEPMVRYGLIGQEDLDLILQTDSVDEAFEYITAQLARNVLDVRGDSPAETG
jgi:predicted Rossmann-fold nucleotide-binding protein